MMNTQITTDDTLTMLLAARHAVVYDLDVKRLIKVRETCDAVVRVQEGTEVICDDAFRGNKTVRRVVLPSSVRSIGKNAFTGCVNLQEVLFPPCLELIGECAFAGCGLDLIELEPAEGVTCTVQAKAFASCPNLSDVFLHKGVMLEGRMTFVECKRLKRVYFQETGQCTHEAMSTMFLGCDNLDAIFVPHDDGPLYQFNSEGYDTEGHAHCDFTPLIDFPELYGEDKWWEM